jgi:hypothetical protein
MLLVAVGAVFAFGWIALHAGFAGHPFSSSPYFRN